MKPEVELAIREVLEAWETPDSPEAMVCAIYQMKRVYRAQVIAGLNKPKIGRPRINTPNTTPNTTPTHNDNAPTKPNQPTTPR